MNISNPKKIITVLVALLVVQGFVIIGFVVSKPTPSEPDHTIVETVTPSPAIRSKALSEGTPQVTIDKNEERQVAQREVKTSQEPQITPLTAEQIANQQEATMNANNLFDNAIAVGKWRQQDTLSLLEYLGNLSDGDAHLLRERFHAAFNAQELDVESFPPL